jgi:hypothetical protein
VDVIASEAKQSRAKRETLDCFVAMLLAMTSGGQMHTELNKLVAALQEFYAEEAFLLEKDLGERALTHRLAVHLERHYPGWQVDCDYNRLGERTLRLPHGTIVSTDDTLGKSIFPDIVVHQREIPNNLLAIEVRKASNHQPIEHDQHKLKAMTDPHIWFAYWIGVLLTLSKRHIEACEVYAAGKLEPDQTRWLAARLSETGLGAP